MPNWYYDKDGNKVGPVSTTEVKTLAEQGIITPETFIENSKGRIVAAKHVNGLLKTPSSSETPPPVEAEVYGVVEDSVADDGVSPPSSSSISLTPIPTPPTDEPNPFAAPMPAEENPFTAPVPEEEDPFTAAVYDDAYTNGYSHAAPPIAAGSGDVFLRAFSAFFSIVWKTSAIIVLLLVLVSAGLTGWKTISEFQKLDTAAEKAVKDALLPLLPLETVSISVRWAEKPGVFDVVKSLWNKVTGSEYEVAGNASGTFSMTIRETEKLFHEVDTEVALSKIGITDLHEKELNAAIEKINDLPEAIQTGLRDTVPGNDLLPFYDVVKEEIVVTGSIGLSRDEEGVWQNPSVQHDPVKPPLKKLIAESRLPRGVYKLDDLEVKYEVERMILGRKEFVAKINAKVAEVQSLDETAKRAVEKDLSNLPLAMKDCEVMWKDITTDQSASGRFTATTRVKEKLYEAVNVREGLKKINPGLSEETINRFPDDRQFYDARLSKDDAVSLKGSITLTKRGNDWQATGDSVQYDSTPPLKDYIATLPPDGYDLDDPKTKPVVNEIIDKIKQQLNFEYFCGPCREYQGHYSNDSNVKISIIFEDIDPTKTTAKGTIMREYQGLPRSGIKLPFSLVAHIGKATDYQVTGRIDNSNLPERKDYVGTRTGEEAKLYRNFYDALIPYTELKIRFKKDGIQVIPEFYIHKPDGRPERLVMTGGRREGGERDGDESGREGTPIGVTDLNEAIKMSGFGGLSDFLRYGNTQLRDNLSAAENNRGSINSDRYSTPQQKAEAQKPVDDVIEKIRNVQTEISHKTFIVTYTHSISDVKTYDTGSRCTMSISTNITFAGVNNGKVLSLCEPDITHDGAQFESYLGGNGGVIRLSIQGSTGSIGLLEKERDKYRVRVTFTNLRRNEHNNNVADIQSIEVIKIK